MSSKPIYSHQVITNGAMSGSINSTVTIISQLSLINYQLTWTGTSPVGDAKIQVSNDYAINSDGSVRNAGTWSDYSSVDSSATQAVSGNTGSLMFNLQSVAAYAIRIRYARTSGTGTLQAFLNAKSFGLGTVPQTFGALGLSALTLLANGNTSLFANSLLTLTGSIVDIMIDSELNVKNTGTASNLALWDIGNTEAIRISAPDAISFGYKLTLPDASAASTGQALVVTSRSAGQTTLDWGAGGGGGFETLFGAAANVTSDDPIAWNALINEVTVDTLTGGVSKISGITSWSGTASFNGGVITNVAGGNIKAVVTNSVFMFGLNENTSFPAATFDFTFGIGCTNPGDTTELSVNDENLGSGGVGLVVVGTYTAGDILEIAVATNGTVTALKNGVVVYTFTGVYGTPLTTMVAIYSGTPNPNPCITSSTSTGISTYIAPSNSLGNNGDVYIHTGTGVFYKKAAGAWTSQVRFTLV